MRLGRGVGWVGAGRDTVGKEDKTGELQYHVHRVWGGGGAWMFSHWIIILSAVTAGQTL